MTPTQIAFQKIREEIEAPLRAEIERLKLPQPLNGVRVVQRDFDGKIVNMWFPDKNCPVEIKVTNVNHPLLIEAE